MSQSTASPAIGKHGQLTLIMGPMFAGKTTELQRRVKREQFAGHTVCVIKYAKDTRYSDTSIASHDQQLIAAKFSVSTLSQVGEDWKAYDVVAIDEGQFFTDLIEFCSAAADMGKRVIVSALDGDFMRKPFGKICELVPQSDVVVKLTAVCMQCHRRDAPFTKRTVGGMEQECIGGAEMYAAVCRECYQNALPPTPGKMRTHKLAMAMISGRDVNVPKDPSCDMQSPAVKKNRAESLRDMTSPRSAAVL